jgi:uncharacterized membrane protein (UPF0127 family)/CheY-like chemotaxis protein
VSGEAKLVVNLTRGNIVCEQTTIADDFFARMRGLLGRSSLPQGEGMLLQPAPSIHTAFMRFRLDAIFLDRNFTVIKTAERIRPFRAVSARRARSVLELPAGEIANRGVEVGDQFVLADPNGGLGDIAQEARPAQGDPTRDEAADDSSRTRVLLIGTDRRFRALASTLLTQHGYSVTVAESNTGLAETAQSESPDVVVFDAGSVPGVAALEAARLEALRPGIPIVLVTDETELNGSAISVVPKWGSFDGLHGAIENARNGAVRQGRASGSR